MKRIVVTDRRMDKDLTPVHVDGSLTIREIVSIEDFGSVQAEWDALLQSSHRPSMFLTHAWLANWWMCRHSDDRELVVLLAYDGGKLIGAAPFMKSTGRLMGLPVKRIEFMTMMPVAASPANCSGELDFILTERQEEVIGSFFRYLRQHHRWDCIRLYPLPENSLTLKVLEGEAAACGSSVHQKEAFANACLHMEQGWDGFFNTVSKHFRRTIRQHEQKLRNLGTVRCVEYRTPFEVEVMYNDVLEIEKTSWKWGKGVAINSVAFKDLYKRFAIEAARLGWMRLWMIELDGKNIAYDYCVAYDGKVQSLKKSYRTEYRQYFPGGVLEAHCFAAMAGEGAREVNLLWGDEEYKSKWSPVMERHVEAMMFNSTAYARFIEKTFFRSDIAGLSEKAAFLLKRSLRLAGVKSSWSELTREDQIQRNRQEAAAPRTASFTPGMHVRVKPPKDILVTLDDSGALEGIVVLPEMLKLSGKVFRVIHAPANMKIENAAHETTKDAIVLHSACCDGAEHDGCNKACTFLWREKWLEPVAHSELEGQVPDSVADRIDNLHAESHVVALCQAGPETAFGKSRFVGLPKLLHFATGRNDEPKSKKVQQE